MLEKGLIEFAMLGAGWVLWLLVILSIGCIAVALERAVYLARDGSDATSLKKHIDVFLIDGEVSKLTKNMKTLTGFEARILGAGLEVSARGSASAERAMSGVAKAEKLRMERGLSFLATVGSNAPFIGLFGTVLGIIQAFHDLAANTSEASEAVMAGISEALVATAVGLLVAIPAVVLYNFFTRWVKGRLARSESLADLVMSQLESDHGK